MTSLIEGIDTTADEFEAGEALPKERRLAMRRSIRMELARFEVVRQEYREQRDRIAQLDGEVDTAVNAYETTAAPIQQELGQIQEQQIAAIAGHEPPDAKLEKRRIDLLRQLEDANARLESVRDECNRRAKPLRVEGQKILSEMPNRDVLETKLLRSATEDQQCEMFALMNAAEWLGYRSADIEKKRQNAESMLSATGKGKRYEKTRAVYQSRARRWQAAGEQLGQSVGQVQMRMSELRHEMLNED